MKNPFLISSIACALVALHAPALGQSKTFDFLGFRNDTTTPPVADLSGKKCKVARTGPSECKLYAGAVIGRARPIDLTVTFNDAYMIRISGSVLPNSYSPLAEAFATKYGPPDSTSSEPWQNRLGMTFENVVQRWLFSDGMLELRQRTQLREMGEFFFWGTKHIPDRPKQEAPPVNF